METPLLAVPDLPGSNPEPVVESPFVHALFVVEEQRYVRRRGAPRTQAGRVDEGACPPDGAKETHLDGNSPRRPSQVSKRGTDFGQQCFIVTQTALGDHPLYAVSLLTR